LFFCQVTTESRELVDKDTLRATLSHFDKKTSATTKVVRFYKRA